MHSLGKRHVKKNTDERTSEKSVRSKLLSNKQVLKPTWNYFIKWNFAQNAQLFKIFKIIYNTKKGAFQILDKSQLSCIVKELKPF